jgi:hypothetical protein
MTGVVAEMLFSVLEDDPDRAGPWIGPLGTGCRPPAVPVEHGCSLVVAGEPPLLPAALHSPTAFAVVLRGQAVRRVTGVSASPR